MALQQLEFTFAAEGAMCLSRDWSHTGVVGSGDMEVLITNRESKQINVKVVTPVSGFEDVWEKVLQRFVTESGICNVSIEINDNNATPYIAALRLRQSIIEAGVKER